MELQKDDHVMTRDGHSASVIKPTAPGRYMLSVAIERVADNGRTIATTEHAEYGVDELELWTDEHEAKFNAERGIVEEP
jgi:hypothetical protein